MRLATAEPDDGEYEGDDGEQTVSYIRILLFVSGSRVCATY